MAMRGLRWPNREKPVLGLSNAVLVWRSRDLEGAVDQGLIQVYDHADLPLVLGVQLRQ